MKAWIAHAVDHNRVTTLALRFNHQCDCFRKRQTVLQFALYRRRAAGDLGPRDSKARAFHGTKCSRVPTRAQYDRADNTDMDHRSR